jgi:hypothetical protein
MKPNPGFPESGKTIVEAGDIESEGARFFARHHYWRVISSQTARTRVI